MTDAKRPALVTEQGSVRMTILDATREADAASIKVYKDSKAIMGGKRGMPFVLKAARNAAEQAAGNDDDAVFAAALDAAKDTLDKSDMATVYDSIHSTM